MLCPKENYSNPDNNEQYKSTLSAEMQADLLDENALLLCEKGKYKEAIQAFEKAYSEKIKLLGIDHEETIRTLANIGNL